MEIEKIQFPDHLNEHGLGQPTLDALVDPSKRAMAIEWAVFNRKLDWLIGEATFLHNLAADHDKTLDLWKRIVWLSGVVWTVIGVGITVWKLLK